MSEILFENEIAIVACMKNETPYVEEWLEFHHQIGVDKFYLYDNDSEDRAELQKILQPWIDSKIVEFIEFPGSLAQISSYNDALEKHRFDSKYMAFIDLDEFIVPKQNRDLIEIVDAVFRLPPPPELLIGGFAINWRVFGSNGQKYKIEGGIIERFTRRIIDSYENNHHVKVIINPRRASRWIIPHNAVYYSGNICIDEHGLHVPLYHNPRNTVDKIQINHYYTKSQEEFELKSSRGRADAHLPYQKIDWKNFPEDVVEDRIALEIFSKPSFHREIYRDDESTIRDLKIMLAEKSENLERILTCFHRAKTLKDLDTREKFESDSLERFFKINVIRIDEAQLFLDTLPTLLAESTRYRKEIVEKGIYILNFLEEMTRQTMRYDEQFDFHRRRDLLELLK